MKVGPFTDGERDRDWLPEDIWASIPSYLHRSIEGYAARHRIADLSPAPVAAEERQCPLVLISREQLARAAFNGRYAATVGKHGDFWDQLAEAGRVRWRAGAEAVIDFLAGLGLPVKGVE